MRAELETDLPWPRLSDLVAEKIGLHFPAERLADLQRGLAKAAQESGCADVAAFARRLLAGDLSRGELHALASHLTIGETYFFRDPKTFEALAARVLPQLLRQRRGEQRLRIWSAGCCTGEEAYTLAILLQQCIPDWRTWHLTILATDINERFLQKAAEAVYGEWSFRDAPAGLKERYFKRTPDGRYALLSEIKQMVTFAPLNLAEDRLPSIATQTQAMDLIFCRNVLMYFTPAQARKVVEKLHRALRDDGWLATSPSESSRTLFAAFEPADELAAVLYRKKRPNAETMPTETPPPPPAASFELDEPAAPPPPASFATQARVLADEGRLDEAVRACDRWIADAPLDCAARYLRAVVLQELGVVDEARRSLQRALYLQPDFVLAHFALGNLARSAGRHSEAQRHFTNALELLRHCAAHEPLPEADGLTAGRLREMLEALLTLETAA